MKLTGIALTNEEQGTQVSVLREGWTLWSPPGPSRKLFAKGGIGTQNVTWWSFCHTIHPSRMPTPEVLASGPYWCQAPKQTLGTDIGRVLGPVPCPRVSANVTPSTREPWLPVCSMIAKAPRLCFLEDCIWTSIVLINLPNKKFLKQKFQYTEAQGADGAVLKTRLWRLWVAVSGLLRSSSGFLMV